jgi:hypothetical protein
MAAQAVPSLPHRLTAFVFRVEFANGERVAYVQTAETGYRVQLPLPADPPPSWADAVDRAQRFVARKTVTA